MIEALISSKTRIKLLLKFFLNSSNKAYLRHLEKEFGESTNAIRVELDRFEDAGMLMAETEGNKKIYKANLQHPLFSEVHSIVRKYVGLDRIVEYVVNRLGNVEKVYLAGSFARGLDSPIIDLVIVGQVDKLYLVELVEKAEALINRKIRYLLIESEEDYDNLYDQMTNHQPNLLVWSQ